MSKSQPRSTILPPDFDLPGASGPSDHRKRGVVQQSEGIAWGISTLAMFFLRPFIKSFLSMGVTAAFFVAAIWFMYPTEFTMTVKYLLSSANLFRISGWTKYLLGMLVG